MPLCCFFAFLFSIFITTSFSSIYTGEKTGVISGQLGVERKKGSVTQLPGPDNIAGGLFLEYSAVGWPSDWAPTGHVMTVGEALQRDGCRDAVEHVQNPNQDCLTFGSQQRFPASLSGSTASPPHPVHLSVCQRLKFSISNLIYAEPLTGRRVFSSGAIKHWFHPAPCSLQSCFASTSRSVKRAGE